MRIRYTIPVERRLRVRNHWPFQWLGGEFQLVEEGGFVTAVQITFLGQPVSYAPEIVQHDHGEIKATITGRDTLLPVVKRRLRRGLAYIQCLFQLELAIGQIRSEFEPEAEAEREHIHMYGLSVSQNPLPLSLTYDFFTRAMLVPEGDDDPELTASFAMASRRAFFEGAFISSFRYAFLLFDTQFGQGQFRSKALKNVFKASPRFRAAVERARRDFLYRPNVAASDTEGLLRTAAGVDALIDHLVDRRGFYFHGQAKHRPAWRPDQQQQAETLAAFAIDVVQALGADAAHPMFEPDLVRKHFESAETAGAVIMLTVDFTYREPEQVFDRTGQLSFNVPGPHPTAMMAAEVAREFLLRFTQETPQAALREARCTTGPDLREVFSLKVHVD